MWPKNKNRKKNVLSHNTFPLNSIRDDLADLFRDMIHVLLVILGRYINIICEGNGFTFQNVQYKKEQSEFRIRYCVYLN